MHRQLPVIVELVMAAEWVRTGVINSVVVTVTVLSEVMSLVVKDEGKLYTNVDKELLELSVKCDDVPILLDNRLLLSVKDCEGDREGESEGDSEADCKEVGEGDK